MSTFDENTQMLYQKEVLAHIEVAKLVHDNIVIGSELYISIGLMVE